MKTLPNWLTTLTLPMPATLGDMNCYLIRGPHGIAMIDTGMDDAASRKHLNQLLRRMKLSMSDIDLVVATHHHPDHCGLGKTLQETGAKIAMSRLDADSLRLFFDHPERDRDRATFSGRHAVPEEFQTRVTAMFPFFRGLQEDFVPDVIVSDGDTVDLCGIEMKVVSVPGHTRGHICLHRPQDRLIFTGDHIIKGDATHVSMREETHGTDPLGRFVDSLIRIRNMGAITGAAGHGRPIVDIGERADQLVRHHKVRIRRMADTLTDTPRSCFDISTIALGERKKVFARWLSMSQTLAYLEHLVATGVALETPMNDSLTGFIRKPV